MKRLLIILYSIVKVASAQTAQQDYEAAFSMLEGMLTDSVPLSFKEAVFTTENTFLSGSLDRKEFDIRIQALTDLAKQLMYSRQLIYEAEDKEKIEKYAAIFSVITDTIPVVVDSNQMVMIPPYSYDFKDIWGHKNWSNMFVSKLLHTKTGNCHSLPYLYKILAEEMGVQAHIATAPNHFYIKHHSKEYGWFNTELTSGIFPVDAWLMASGYVHLDAIANKIYMEALSDKQAIALCVIDLAQGYEKKAGLLYDSQFVLKCCNLALAHYPHYINALLLKAETYKKQFDRLMEKHLVEHAAEILHIPEARQLFSTMNSLYSQIHKLGYRKMPENMYLDWLLSLKKERNKFENKNIVNFNTKSQ